MNSEDGPEKLLVIGSTGRVGQALLSALAKLPTDQRPRLRLLVRRPETLPNPPAEAEIIQGDMQDVGLLLSAMQGVGRIFMLVPDNPDQVEFEQNVIAAAQQSGRPHIVKFSAITAGLELPKSFGILHRQGEDALRASGLPYTIIRPTMFFQSLELFADPILKAGKIIVPSGKGATAFVDIRDIAAFAVHILTTADHEGKIYTLTGPQALTMAQTAKKLAAHMQRPIKHISPPTFIARLMLRFAAGMDRWMAGMVVDLFAAIRAGGEAEIHSDFEQVMGFKPLSIDHYLTQQQVFRSSMPIDKQKQEKG